VLDFKSIYSAKGAHGASAEPDQEKPNQLESFQIGRPDLSHPDILSLISAAESRELRLSACLPPLCNFAPLRAKLPAGLRKSIGFKLLTRYGGVVSMPPTLNL
jgi:hypothetical protein